MLHRRHVKGETTLPNGSLVDYVYSHDCNSLYLWGLGEPTGTGIYRMWRTDDSAEETPAWKRPQSNGEALERQEAWNQAARHNMQVQFKRRSAYKFGNKELEYLEWTSHESNKPIEHRFNGRPKTVFFDKNTRYTVDGYDPSTNTIYQFHGCSFHGHGCKLDSNELVKSAALRENTNIITTRLASLGFTVCERWECQWEEEKKQRGEIREFIRTHLALEVRAYRLSGAQLLEKIREKKIFGMIECDIEINSWDNELLEYFEEFPPICKNTDISLDDIGEHMKQYAEEHGYMTRSRRNLISSFWARKILLTTPILCWLLEHGLKVSRIYQVIEMKPKACFSSIKDIIIDERRRADTNPAFEASGKQWKTLGNSLYGKSMTAKERHKDCKLVLDDQVSNYVNNVRFHAMEEIGDIAYEVSMDKRRIKLDLPLTVAFFVYNYAKLKMLNFVYDFLKKYLRAGSYQIVCSDTDSIIAAYESRDIDSLVKPDLLQEYLAHGKQEYLVHDAYSLRTPGLFKEELGATGIIALCSKTYFAWNDEDETTKVSSKGLSKVTNKFTSDDFQDVLDTREKGMGVNYGFKVHHDELLFYRQVRHGLPYLYVKRKVLDDGVSTVALSL